MSEEKNNINESDNKVDVSIDINDLIKDVNMDEIMKKIGNDEFTKISYFFINENMRKMNNGEIQRLDEEKR